LQGSVGTQTVLDGLTIISISSSC